MCGHGWGGANEPAFGAEGRFGVRSWGGGSETVLPLRDRTEPGRIVRNQGQEAAFPGTEKGVSGPAESEYARARLLPGTDVRYDATP